MYSNNQSITKEIYHEAGGNLLPNILSKIRVVEIPLPLNRKEADVVNGPRGEKIPKHITPKSRGDCTNRNIKNRPSELQIQGLHLFRQTKRPVFKF